MVISISKQQRNRQEIKELVLELQELTNRQYRVIKNDKYIILEDMTSFSSNIYQTNYNDFRLMLKRIVELCRMSIKTSHESLFEDAKQQEYELRS